MHRKLGALFALLMVSLLSAFALAGPAAAEHTGHPHPSASHQDAAEGCGVVLTFDNPTDWYYLFDYRIDGEDALDSDEYGPLWRTVEVDGRDGVHQAEVPVQFKPGTGKHAVEYRVARGAESDLYDWTTWWEGTVDCGGVTPTAPTATDETCDESGSITIPQRVKGVKHYKLDGVAVLAGTYSVAPGEHKVRAVLKRGYVLADDAKKVWKLTVAPAKDCEPSPGPSASPSTDPSPSTGPSVDPSASTTPPVHVTDDPNGLPTTGFGGLPWLIGSGAALVASGAGILLLIARRRGWLYS